MRQTISETKISYRVRIALFSYQLALMAGLCLIGEISRNWQMTRGTFDVLNLLPMLLFIVGFFSAAVIQHRMFDSVIDEVSQHVASLGDLAVTKFRSNWMTMTGFAVLFTGLLLIVANFNRPTFFGEVMPGVIGVLVSAGTFVIALSYQPFIRELR